MKVICLSIVFIAFVGIALINLRYYRQRLQLVKDLLSFFEIYINEISFNKSDYMTIVSRNDSKFSSYCQVLLHNYLDISKYPTNLNMQEKKDLFLIFSDLGRHDLDSEIGVCNNAKVKLLDMKERAMLDCKAKGELRAKMIFVLGLVLLIIIM